MSIVTPNQVEKTNGLRNPPLFLPAMDDEFPVQLLSVPVDVDAELGENGEPDILGPNQQVVMVTVRIHGCPNEAIGRRLKDFVFLISD